MRIVTIKWKLRKVMAERNIWSGAELGRLLEDKASYKLSAPSISGLLTNEPKQVKTKTMDALCNALDCSPNDLWEHTPTPIEKLVKPTKDNLEEVVGNDISIDIKLPPI